MNPETLEHKTASFLAKGLTEEGFVVDISTDGLDGQHNIDHIHYDLIILDVMLPGKDGYSILEDLRQAKKQTPVCNYSAAENYRNITLRAVMIFYSPIGSRNSKIS